MTPILKKKLHWLPVRHCIVYKILSLVYKAINGAVPCCISDSLNCRTSKRTLWSVLFSTPSSDHESETKRHFKTYLFKKAHNSFQFYQMINMFNDLRIFSICLFLYIDIEIFFSFPPFFQLFYDLNVKHHGQLVGLAMYKYIFYHHL